MDNQHRKIEGYRELSQEEIDLMNRIKAKGAELLELQAELMDELSRQKHEKERAANALSENSVWRREYLRFQAAEPLRWASIGKTDIQTGIMALVRAVAQPTNC